MADNDLNDAHTLIAGGTAPSAPHSRRGLSGKRGALITVAGSLTPSTAAAIIRNRIAACIPPCSAAKDLCTLVQRQNFLFDLVGKPPAFHNWRQQISGK